MTSLGKEERLSREQFNIRKELNDKQLVARTELLATESRLAEVAGELRCASDGVAVAASALDEAKQQRIELDARVFKELELESGRVATELAEVSQGIVRLRDKLQRMELRAPVDGVVQGLTVNNTEAVVSPGDVIIVHPDPPGKQTHRQHF